MVWYLRPDEDCNPKKDALTDRVGAVQEPSFPLPRRRKGQRKLIRPADAEGSHDDASEGHPEDTAGGHGRDNGKEQGGRGDDVKEEGWSGRGGFVRQPVVRSFTSKNDPTVMTLRRFRLLV